MRANRLAQASALAVLVVAATAASPLARPLAGDDLTFRATVIVRRGDGQGSGAVIASAPGETLVLTAAHVVHGKGPVVIEVHRFNLGREHSEAVTGWPVALVGEVAAEDRSADVAVVRVRGKEAMPFVARLTAPGDEPDTGAAVTSIGVDGGAKLESWRTRVRDVSWFSMGHDPAADPRPFLITEKAPVPGRSGGGLFLEDGRLSGVCVGRIERPRGRAWGVFAAPESVRLLLRDHDLETSVARSEAAHDQQALNGHSATTLRRSSPTP